DGGVPELREHVSLSEGSHPVCLVATDDDFQSDGATREEIRRPVNDPHSPRAHPSGDGETFGDDVSRAYPTNRREFGRPCDSTEQGVELRIVASRHGSAPIYITSPAVAPSPWPRKSWVRQTLR